MSFLSIAASAFENHLYIISSFNKRRKDLFWFMVSVVSVHHGVESVEGREVHTMVARKKEENASGSRIFTLPPFIPSGFAPQRVDLFTFRADLPLLDNPFWKCLHRPTQECILLISYVFLTSVKVTVKINFIHLTCAVF
jgi:hypothetical protein